jgi:hypothetical protein
VYSRLSAIILVFGATVACSRGTSGVIEKTPLEVHREAAYSLNVPAGSKVAIDADVLTVDAPDGSRWFDVRFLPADADPLTTFKTWASATCPSHALDPVEMPVPNVTTVGGVCSIEHRRHWLLGAIEPWGDRKIATLYVADAALITIEDAWVDYARTALTLSPGDQPFEAVTPADVRAAARAAQEEGAGPDQVPGGGVLWGRTSKHLAPLWTARASRRP